ncbi:Methyltransferase domain-containing protein [Sphingobium faniae]|uniref:Eco57I restriction-modification methylase domain-containing protein n=1 Tax=Rhizorhapis sp. SPR117 TaxID=2912611 RepID=UPI0008763512|nr:N-6 DNA methylase [Rhizorhapis sp. SPR117]SCW86649.1 Methyltransferase domain-containing protein [Sphingobium faniae]
MARSTRAAELGLVAVTIEGGLIAPEQVQKIVAADRTAKTADSYGCPKGTGLGDEISRYFRIGQHIWKDYDRIDAPTVTQTAQFAHDLLTQCFGFTDLAGPVEHQDGTRRYRLAWEAKDGRVPVVVAAPVVGADAFNKAQPEFGDGEGGRPRRSPVSLLQDWLNATDHALWGLVFAGDRVRLMRDNASLTRPAWIEADLGAMFRDEMFADFTAWWLVAHATRFGAAGAPPSESPLEHWREEGMKQGIQARADLRRNVEDALSELGQGLVEANPELVERIRSGALPLQSLFRELLRTVYRLIFLAVAEDRDLLHPRRTPQAARSLYADSYSFTFWRERSRRRVARDGHLDAWEAMKVTLSSLEHGQELLGLPALGGLFAKSETPSLNDALIPNRRFLSAIFCLGFIRKDGVTHRINWRDLKTEELGSVYESLLEIRPRLEPNGAFTLDSGAKGNDRKTSGSYYTPDSLVETLLDSALDPVLQKAEDGADTAEDKVAAILDLRVIDPACGSGHFLLGAARRMADRVAKLRNEDAGKEETQAALRDVISRCIHGVDRNPMAVELAKVALWIESVSPGQPLGFLDGNIRCGDALLGVFDFAALEEGIPDEAYKPLTGDDKETASGLRKLNKSERDAGLLKLAFDPGKLSGEFSKFHRMTENSQREVAARAAEFDRIRQTPDWLALRQACDIYVSAFLLPKPKLPSLAKPLVPTTAHLRNTVSGGTMLQTGTVQGELAMAIDSAAFAASAFHWPLEFPDVVVGRRGFDVVLGNPPWEVVQLGEQEYFESRVPEIAEMKGAARKKAIAALEQSHPEIFEEFARDKRTFEAMNEFARASGRFDLTARGKVNTYGLFAEHFLNLTREGGRAGVIVPTGIATDATTAPFFGHLVSGQRLAGLTDFENSAPLFAGVHRSFKLCLLTIGSAVASADFAFFLTDPAQLEDERRRFTLSPGEIARINPNTKTAPVFRSRRDAELTASICNRVPVLIEEGKEGGNAWGVEFRQGLFNMTSDSHLFRTAAQLTEEGFFRDGPDWLREGVTAPAPASSMQAIMAEAVARNAPDLLAPLTLAPEPLSVSTHGAERYVPLYEAKMIHQFNHRFGDGGKLEERPVSTGWPNPLSHEIADPDYVVHPWYWVPSTEVDSSFSERDWQRGWTFNWRRNARATDERTLLAVLIPRCGIGDNLFTAFLAKSPNFFAAFYANWNSLVVDLCLRQKAGGANMSFYLIEQLPILPPSAYSEADLAFIVPRVLELTYTSHAMAPFARDLGYEGPPFAWDEDGRATLRAELDAWYALAYGLARDELRYVLDPKDVMGPDYPSETFRVLQNNERAKYGEYRTQRLVLAAYDELMAQGMRPRLDGYR